MSGITSYLAGQVAEDRVAAIYTDAGCHVLHTRWRTARGEIDLILMDGSQLVFVEVKKSQSLARAALRLSRAQTGRLWATAEAYLSKYALSLDTDLRFDVALMDDQGHVDIVENALVQ